MTGDRTILVVDMDAFFASVEQQANPRLRGRPVAVVGSAHRTVITTRSYEARRYGVKTGMSIPEARQRCPDLLLIIGDNEKYTHTCRTLTGLYRRFTPDLEIYSIDEAFLDITTTHHLFGGPEAIGREIKAGVKRIFGINCTIGIGPNVLIGKLASDLAKPDGLRWIRQHDVPAALEDLPVKELWGIGSRTESRLLGLGIRTCGQLGRAPASLLRSCFGICGETLRQMGQGVWERPVRAKEEEPKSIGHSMTLPRDIWRRQEIEAYLLRLSEMVGRRARKYGYQGRTASLVVRYRDFETFSRQMKTKEATNDSHEIYLRALKILGGIRLRDRVRLLGVSMSDLVADPGQLALIEIERKRQALFRAIDGVNDRYGDFAVSWASYLQQEREAGVISPAWRPSGVRHVHLK